MSETLLDCFDVESTPNHAIENQKIEDFTYTIDTADGFMIEFIAPQTIQGFRVWAREEADALEKVEQAKQLHRSSAHLQKRWKAPWGEVASLKLVSLPTLGEGSELYEVGYSDGSYRRIAARDMDRVIAKQSFDATPEGIKAAEVALQAVIAHNEAIARLKADEEAKQKSIEAMIDEWLEVTSYTAIQRGAAKKVLLSEFMYSALGESLSRVCFVKKMIDDGAQISTWEENKVKEKSRRQWNRMDNHEQTEHERKVKAGGVVTRYGIGNYTVTKTEYDYAQFLLRKAQKKECQD